jgi:hypothetical protein
VKEWCQFLKLEEAFDCGSMAEVRGVLATSREARLASLWEVFTGMRSTAFVASLVGSPSALSSILHEASKFGILGVCASLLIFTGSLAVSYDKSHFCVCGENFSFHLFWECPRLRLCRTHSLRLAVERKDWQEVAVIILSRFELYLHAIRGGKLWAEEIELFSNLNSAVTDWQDLGDLASVF